MKKFALLLTFVPLSLYCFNLPWFSRPKPQEPDPCILTIKISDPIKFDEVTQALFNATRRSDVCGVVIAINSNGGYIAEFSVLYDMIKKLSAAKPTVCLVAASACSCGYMLASATHYIFAHSFSSVGSIGLYIMVDRYKNVQVKDGYIKADMEREVLFAGGWKGLFHFYASDLTDEQRAAMHDELMELYDGFVSLVADNRHLDKKNAKEWAEGRTFTASAALKLGLIDAIGTIFDAEEKMRQLIKERYHMANVQDVELVFEN